jgi:hypothetical protein
LPNAGVSGGPLDLIVKYREENFSPFKKACLK